MRYILQMYTLRKAARRDLPFALRQAADLGYEGVESYKLRPDGKAQSALKAGGVAHVSAQLRFSDLRDGWDRHIRFLRETGCGIAVVAMPPLAVIRGGPRGWEAFCEQLNQLGEDCHANGIRLAYHHHQFEFVRLGDIRPIDLLMDRLSGHVGFVCDTFRAQQGGACPAALIKALSGRLAGIHLRDYTLRRKGFSFRVGDCPLGQGNLNIPALLEAAEEAGATYAAVEQDSARPMEDAAESLRYIQAIRREKQGGTYGKS